MVKHTQTICGQPLANFLVVLDHFVKLALQELIKKIIVNKTILICGASKPGIQWKSFITYRLVWWMRPWEKKSIWETFARFGTICTIKKTKNTHGEVLLSVELKAKACNFTENNTPPWVFFTFLNCINGIKSRQASRKWIMVLDLIFIWSFPFCLLE